MEYLEQPLKESYKEIYSKTLQTNQSGIAKSCANNQQKDMKKKTEKPKTEGTNRKQLADLNNELEALTYQLYYIQTVYVVYKSHKLKKKIQTGE